MAFLDVSFPRTIARNAVSASERRVDVVTLSSGYEERNAIWRNSRRSFEIGLAIRTLDDLQEVRELFEQAGGSLHSFRFRDWSDYRSSPVPSEPEREGDQDIGLGDGSKRDFQIRKIYGTTLPHARDITKPHTASVRVAINGGLRRSGWRVNPTTGVITFDRPPSRGRVVSAGFTFDVPVRFASDRLDVDLAYYSQSENRGLASAPDISLLEVRE